MGISRIDIESNSWGNHVMDFPKELEKARNVSEIFKLVKTAVWVSTGQSRSGLELGLSSLDNRGSDFLGAFYPMDSNILVINQIPLERIAYLDTTLYNPYVFHILLYEYLRSMGYTNEPRRRELAQGISEELFGADHLVSMMAKNIRKFFPNMTYAMESPKTPLRTKVVKEFDNFATSYIG